MDTTDSMHTDLAGIWARLRQELAACDAALLAELRIVSAQVQETVRAGRDLLPRCESLPDRAPGLQALAVILGEEAQVLFLDPMAEHRARGSYRHALRAFSDHDARVEDVVASIPEATSVSRRQWRDAVGTTGPSVARRLARWVRAGRRPLPLRHNLLAGIYTLRVDRRREQGTLLREIADVSLDVLDVWKRVAGSRLAALSAQAARSVLTTDVARALDAMDAHARSVAASVARIEAWLAGQVHALSTAVPLAPVRDPARLERLQRAYFACVELWTRQGRAVDEAIDADIALLAAEHGLARSAAEFSTLVAAEHGRMLGELDHVIQWLQLRGMDREAAFPAAHLDLVPAVQRLDAWRALARPSLDRAPERLEIASALQALPGVRSRWQTQYPRQVLERSVEKYVAAHVEPVVRDMERQHRTTLREIEHVRDVVEFAVSDARDAVEPQIESEATSNARSLLEFHRRQIQEPPGLDPLYASTLAAAFTEARAVLDGAHVRIWADAARRGLPETARLLRQRTRLGGRWAAGEAGQRTADAYRELLIRIGWTPAPSARLQHVITRPYARPFVEDAPQSRVPVLYQRLFRLQPIDDARFLVGRTQELAALREARRFWEHGRAASVLIVGERGSGKTSLINCALASVFADVEPIRGEFSARVTEVEALHAFLAELTGLDDPAHLVTHLTNSRRVVVLEEIERTFLRQLHHYDVVRELLRLVVETSSATLWIVATNYTSFTFLDTAVQLDAHFSHRINAMAVEPEHLREAILLRHNLSGLRLHVKHAGRASWSERVLGAEDMADRERRFHDAIHEHSAGVFRSAFALWLKQIDRVENGILYMLPPTRPAHDALVSALSTQDLFLLTALLQHGSLTPREAGTVLSLDEPVARQWLNALLAREIVEPDPLHPGYRVLPEAAALVQQALYRRNLA